MNKTLNSEFLDELVAIHVFEEEKPTREPDNELVVATAMGSMESIFSSKRAWVAVGDFDEGDIAKWVPNNFSSNLDSAWRVIEKIDERFNAFVKLEQVHVDKVHEPHTQWLATFYEKGTDKVLGKSLPAPSAAWALSEAAVAIAKANKNEA